MKEIFVLCPICGNGVGNTIPSEATKRRSIVPQDAEKTDKKLLDFLPVISCDPFVSR